MGSSSTKPRAALAGTFVALVAGCGSFDPGPSNPNSLACAGDPTHPLSAKVVTRVLRRHHFTVVPEPPNPANVICGGLGDRAEEMPLTLVSHDQVIEREGHVICGLRRGPIWGRTLKADLDAPPSSPVFSGRKAEFKVANLECNIYPHGERTEVQITNLYRAMQILARLAY